MLVPCDETGYCPEDHRDDPPPPPPYSGPRQNVVFQHGGFSDAGTWARMDPWLSADFYLGTKVEQTTGSRDRIATQGDRLLSAVQATGQNGFVFIGHSNGGLVSRYAAQRRPDLARGVVTISTPHGGVHLARQSRLALRNYLTNLIYGVTFGCNAPNDDPGCFLGYFLLQQSLDAATAWA
jgi:pimeloyl-ACP methyl ester carboxylesterase